MPQLEKACVQQQRSTEVKQISVLKKLNKNLKNISLLSHSGLYLLLDYMFTAYMHRVLTDSLEGIPKNNKYKKQNKALI